MSRPLWRRFGAFALLNVFSLFWGASFALGSCPMHDAVPADAVALGHAGHDVDAEGAGSHGSAPASVGCSCLGACLAGVSLALPGRAPTTVVASRYAGATPAPTGVPDVEHRGQTRLPFAHAPPASAFA